MAKTSEESFKRRARGESWKGNPIGTYVADFRLRTFDIVLLPSLNCMHK